MKRSLLVLVLLFFSLSLLYSQSGQPSRRLALQGGIGISGATGDYASEYQAAPEFSFNPGLRLWMKDYFYSDSVLLVDLGYLETGFVGNVIPTESRFWNTYTYLNLNAMLGKWFDKFYLAGGLYLGIGLDAYSYKEYEDRWVSFDSNGDFGLAGEGGMKINDFLTLGVQVKKGLKSIGSSVDIKNWVLHANFSITLLRF